MSEGQQGCARVTGVVSAEKSDPINSREPTSERKERIMTAKVGQKAPDFSAPAYYKGEFTSVQLSDYLEKWVLVCFYPGDFTFV